MDMGRPFKTRDNHSKCALFVGDVSIFVTFKEAANFFAAVKLSVIDRFGNLEISTASKDVQYRSTNLPSANFFDSPKI